MADDDEDGADDLSGVTARRSAVLGRGAAGGAGRWPHPRLARALGARRLPAEERAARARASRRAAALSGHRLPHASHLVWQDRDGRADAEAITAIAPASDQDRILFGTDAVPNGHETPQQIFGDPLYEIYYRFLETEDEYFDYAPAPVPPQGRWRIYGIGLPEAILKQVYHDNAARLLGLDPL